MGEPALRPGSGLYLKRGIESPASWTPAEGLSASGLLRPFVHIGDSGINVFLPNHDGIVLFLNHLAHRRHLRIYRAVEHKIRHGKSRLSVFRKSLDGSQTAHHSRGGDGGEHTVIGQNLGPRLAGGKPDEFPGLVRHIGFRIDGDRGD